MTNKLANAIFNQGNVTTTQNGAKAFKTTGSACLDFYSRAGALRNDQSALLDLFKRAFAESPEAAIVLAFNLRDIRGGSKERLSGQNIFKWLYENHEQTFNKIVSLIPEYGYWKDIIPLYNSPAVVNAVSIQLAKDALSDHPSLLAKWMPSANAGKAARKLAKSWMIALQIENEAEYRRGLSAIRANIGPVEGLMSAKKWELVQYEGVPAVAMKRYGKAFAKHDHARFDAFIKAAVRGEVEVKAGTLLPHELLAQYVVASGYSYRLNSENDVVEAQWKNLEDYTNGENVLVMPDVSGSMISEAFGKVTAFHTSIALAIYFAQRNNGAFKNQFVTFSKKPKFITLQGTSLHEAIETVLSDVEMANTDLMASIKGILDIAKKNKVPQKHMPTKIVIVSDMQFDCTGDMTNFEAMKSAFKAAGYQMPEIVFWTVNASIKKNTPVTKNEHGVALVSGASPASLQFVLGGKIESPMETMLKTLNAERYKLVREVLGM